MNKITQLFIIVVFKKNLLKKMKNAFKKNVVSLI
jgi:hypothetical protein